MKLLNGADVYLETMAWGVRCRFSLVDQSDHIDIVFSGDEIGFHYQNYDEQTVKKIMHDLINEAEWVVDESR